MESIPINHSTTSAPTTTSRRGAGSRQISKIKASGCVKEHQRHRQPLWCVAWSDDVFMVPKQDDESFDEDLTKNETETENNFYRIFASCGGRYATIYEVQVLDPSKRHGKNYRSGNFRVKQHYIDSDEKEDFYACAFGGRSWNPNTPPSFVVKYPQSSYSSFPPPKKAKEDQQACLDHCNSQTRHSEICPEQDLPIEDEESDIFGPRLLCLAGNSYSIKVIDTAQAKLMMTLSGHGDMITSLKFNPVNDWILLSASNDRSCRIWNLKSASCCAILAGHEGHRHSVDSASWHPFGDRVISGGHDTTVKIWNVGEGTAVHEAIQQSFEIKLSLNETWAAYEAARAFKPVIWQFPIFSTNKVHLNPVDCVEFLGDLVLSKSYSSIVLWEPDYSNKDRDPNVTHPPPRDVKVLDTFDVKGSEKEPPDQERYFYRFSTDARCEYLAVGTTRGEVIVKEIGAEKNGLHLILGLEDKALRLIQMTAFSPEDRILLICGSDGTIFKMDIDH